MTHCYSSSRSSTDTYCWKGLRVFLSYLPVPVFHTGRWPLPGRKVQWFPYREHSEESASPLLGVPWMFNHACLHQISSHCESFIRTTWRGIKRWKVLITFLFHKTCLFLWPLPAFFHLHTCVGDCDLSPHLPLWSALFPPHYIVVTSPYNVGWIFHPVVIPQSFPHFTFVLVINLNDFNFFPLFI